MPIYEFRCNACSRITSVFARSIGGDLAPVCSSCGTNNLSRLISRVAVHKSTKTIWEESGTPATNPNYYNDPRNIGREMEDRFKSMGEEMPSEVSSMLQAAREGDLPESVKSLQPTLKEV